MALEHRVLKLHRVQPFILSVSLEEFLVRSNLDNSAAVEHDDSVRILNGGQPMRNDQSGSVIH